MSVIEVHNVSKVYPTRQGARVFLGRGGLGDWFRGRKKETFKALDNVSLEVNPGESLGIIGRNGSGKSTLLKILAGVSLPTTGEVVMRGRVASLLELGAGFHPMLTGRENVYLNAGLLGMRHAQAREVFDQIVAFSGIGDFIDQPVDTYSSGMYVRIAFAVAVHVNPDIFLVDEVLSVGDEDFQRKCRRKIGEFREQKKTLVFVSHDLGIVNTLCERVVLLNHGKMMHRETTQKTISFYLRQVGREKGVHTFSKGDTEAIVCDGRISLFHKQEEISAANGFRINAEHMGQLHASTDAEWAVVDRQPASCTAQGHMSRLPLTWIWKMTVEEGRFSWEISMECHREIIISYIEIASFFPAAFTRWFYGDLSDTFPLIHPTDVTWNFLAASWELLTADGSAMRAMALPEESSSLPPMEAQLTAHNPLFAFAWANSEYSSHSRILVTHARFPERESRFASGKHALATIAFDLNTPRDEIAPRFRSNRSIESGPLTATFERGCIRLTYEGIEFTKLHHVYTSIFLQHIWHDSLNLHWGTLQNDGVVLRATGESRRFPFQQHWEVRAIDDGAMALTIWLEALEAFHAQEYQTSIVLAPEYESWRTDQEEGAFPPFNPDSGKWQHLNKTYAVGKLATALSSTLPSVTIENTAEEVSVRMTPINTKPEENARVLQALRVSESGLLYFPPGRHLYFSGAIRVAPSVGK